MRYKDEEPYVKVECTDLMRKGKPSRLFGLRLFHQSFAILFTT